VIARTLPLILGIVAVSSLATAAGLPSLKAERWVNSAPQTTEALRGKVVLIDFWEYTCVNWIRTSPYVKAWHRDYAALGLVVVGVHSSPHPMVMRSEALRARSFNRCGRLSLKIDANLAHDANDLRVDTVTGLRPAEMASARVGSAIAVKKAAAILAQVVNPVVLGWSTTQLLRPILSVAVYPHTPASEHGPRGVGAAEIQTISASRASVHALVGSHRAPGTVTSGRHVTVGDARCIRAQVRRRTTGTLDLARDIGGARSRRALMVANLAKEPALSSLPVPHHGLRRHIQHIRCFSDGQAAKESQLDDLAHTPIKGRQSAERIAEGDEVYPL